MSPFVITFIGADQGKVIPPLVATNNLSGGIDPEHHRHNRLQAGAPTPIVSTPNAVAARDGNSAHIAVIVDGSQIPGVLPAS